MLISRRQLLIGTTSVGAGCLFPNVCRAGALFEGIPFGKAPGDYGFKHDQYHPYYKRVFGEIGKCACGYGDCRVSDWRITRMGSPVGFDIIVNRHWYPLPKTVWIPKAEDTPPELQTERAHVCAYDGIAENTPNIPCAIIIVPVNA